MSADEANINSQGICMINFLVLFHILLNDGAGTRLCLEHPTMKHTRCPSFDRCLRMLCNFHALPSILPAWSTFSCILFASQICHWPCIILLHCFTSLTVRRPSATDFFLNKVHDLQCHSIRTLNGHSSCQPYRCCGKLTSTHVYRVSSTCIKTFQYHLFQYFLTFQKTCSQLENMHQSWQPSFWHLNPWGM